jgi:hypothetical protein
VGLLLSSVVTRCYSLRYDQISTSLAFNDCNGAKSSGSGYGFGELGVAGSRTTDGDGGKKRKRGRQGVHSVSIGHDEAVTGLLVLESA